MGYTVDQLKQLAREKAVLYGIDPNLFVAQIQQESQFDPNAVSSAGAQGIAQFMPGTAAGMGLKNPFDPVTALDASAKYMSNLYKKYGKYDVALAAYNAGSGNVAKYGGIPPFKETQAYVRTIMGAQGRGNAPASPQAGSGAPVNTATSKTPSVVFNAAGAYTDKNAPATSPFTNTPFQDALVRKLQSRMQGNMFAVDDTNLMDFVQARQQETAQAPGALVNQGVAPLKVDVQPEVAVGLPQYTSNIINEAMRYKGTPYHWGGADPRTGFDCSGFIQYLYGKQGVKMPRTASEQYGATSRVDKGSLAPGDLVFFAPPDGDRASGAVGHVGLYIGNNRFIQSPKTGDVVKISSLDEPYYAKQFISGGRPRH